MQIWLIPGCITTPCRKSVRRNILSNLKDKPNASFIPGRSAKAKHAAGIHRGLGWLDSELRGGVKLTHWIVREVRSETSSKASKVSHRQKRARAFTLVELLVVIALIAIVASL